MLTPYRNRVAAYSTPVESPMFTSNQHLPQRLSRDHYTSPEIYERELETIFLPSWHCIGTLIDAPKLGDYFTCDLFGRPLVCWHTSQGFQAFLNVCTHRFCTLTDKRKGQFAERIKCQYHGWEYDETGNTCRIPDAQHFRPLKKGELGLREFRTESVGQLVFVNLNDNPVSVREHLGPELTQWCEKYFSPQHRLTQYNQIDLACNWKIVVENILEAYHIACVHPKSFGMYPPADSLFHEFHPTWDYYKVDSSNARLSCFLESLVAKMAGREPEHYWEHILRYPNFVLGGAGPWHYVQTVVPTGPETCRSTWYNLHNAGPRGRFVNFLLHRILYRVGKRIAYTIQGEDAAIYPSVHRGTAARHRPYGGGLISAREERIFTFQDYILKSLANDARDDVVPTPPPPEGIDAAIFRQPRTTVASAN